jgi:hypothetical protein
MIDSGHGDKTAGRVAGLLKIRYANRNKNHTFSIYFQTMPRTPRARQTHLPVAECRSPSSWPRKFSGLETAAIFQLAAAQCLYAEDAPFQVQNAAALAAGPESFPGSCYYRL